MKMKNKDFFFLAPPLFSHRGYGIAVIQLGLDFSESMLLRMTCWSGSDYIKFWHNELSAMLLNVERNKGLLPTGIYEREDGRIYFLERWDVHRLGSEFVFRDKTVIADNDVGYSAYKEDRKDWWKGIGNYEDGINLKGCDGEIYSESEWRVSARAVADWCHKYSCVFAQMDNVDSDVEFSW